MIKTSFTNAINQAFADAMEDDPKVICMGLGVTDPKGIFGTTIDLEKKFGSERVFDVPTSENALTGICAGMGIGGYKPILSHQRLDFALLSLDQIINNIAKVSYMFGGQIKCPIVIRMIVGRGWGQGPTHSQNLQALFAGIPGLKTLIPSTPQDAYSQLRASIDSPDPCIFLEHRWLHNSMGNLKRIFHQNDLNKQRTILEGKDYTVAVVGHMLPEVIKARNFLEKNFSILGEVISFKNYCSYSIEELIKSCEKTKHLIFVDTAQKGFSIGHEIIHNLLSKQILEIKNCKLIALPNVPMPTSHHLTKYLYNNFQNIIEEISLILDLDYSISDNEEAQIHLHDVPGEWFRGPF